MNISQLTRGSAFESDVFPRYYNLVDAGFVFGVSYTAAAGTVASATATGPFALFNPAASGVQLVILSAALLVTGSTTAGGAGIGFQFVPNQQPSATTPGNTPQNALIGSAAASKANVFTAGTLVGAPTVSGYLIDGVQFATAVGIAISAAFDIAGAVIVNPGSGFDVVVTSTTPVLTLTPSLIWAEIPLG